MLRSMGSGSKQRSPADATASFNSSSADRVFSTKYGSAASHTAASTCKTPTETHNDIVKPSSHSPGIPTSRLHLLEAVLAKRRQPNALHQRLERALQNAFHQGGDGERHSVHNLLLLVEQPLNVEVKATASCPGQ
jgi:hypothetical protein